MTDCKQETLTLGTLIHHVRQAIESGTTNRLDDVFRTRTSSSAEKDCGEGFVDAALLPCSGARNSSRARMTAGPLANGASNPPRGSSGANPDIVSRATKAGCNESLPCSEEQVICKPFPPSAPKMERPGPPNLRGIVYESGMLLG